MKKILFLPVILSLFLLNPEADAAFVSGSTGALAAFNPTANTEVVLPPDGILNYTTINIPLGVTITFKKNTANTPVYMLATGDVAIAGTINVSSTTVDVMKGGPGGFDGGYGGLTNLVGGKGLGPGGGGSSSGTGAGGGGFGSEGASFNASPGGKTYGNLRLLPFIGGSGGGGGSYKSEGNGGNGGGGGGAIVIVSSTSINVAGSITANGRNGTSGSYYNGGGGGSGGAVKLVANEIMGNGAITAQGGTGLNVGGRGGSGRIRLEASTISRTAATDPPYSSGTPSPLFVANPPTLKITSIAGTTVPDGTTGSYSQPDIELPNSTSNPVIVTLSASNIPIATAVSVSVIPQFGNVTTVTTTLSGTQQASTATTSVTIISGYSNIIIAEATFTVVAMYYDGEEIDKVKVAATLGGISETTYITKSGKKIKGELVAALK